MTGYEEYLENIIDLRDKEITCLNNQIDIYKSFIEKELRCKIKETVESSIEFGKRGVVNEVFYKVITIPKSQYIVKIESVGEL